MSQDTRAATQLPPLTPTQQIALDELLVLVRARAMPLVELQSPPALGRGHGVTSVLRGCSVALGVPLLGVSTTLAAASAVTGGDASAAVRTLQAAAMDSLEKHGLALIDDADLAVAPRAMRRNRTLVGSLRGSGDVYSWDVVSAPAMLLKSLSDTAAASGGTVVFSALEDAHLAFMQVPLTVKMGEPKEPDYTAVIRSRIGAEVAAGLDVGALYAMHSQLSAGDVAALTSRASASLPNAGPAPRVPSTEALLGLIRKELTDSTAVSPEDVETVDLASYPGLEGIKEELEKNVLFPLENPELAAKLGLAPKRGVLVHGKPGTGKTTIGRWLAHRLKGKFFLVGEMMLHADIIKVFAAARAAAPAVVFIDDADIVIGGWRPLDGHRGSDVFRFLLSTMDGITSRGGRVQERGDVVVMLTGQSVHWMADMLLRSGRIELWLKTKLPEPRQKREILKKYISEDPGALELLGAQGQLPDVRAAAQISDHFCCADLRRIVADAKMLAAWDRQNGVAVDGKKDYLEKAAEYVRHMQQEVYENTRHLYG